MGVPFRIVLHAADDATAGAGAAAAFERIAQLNAVMSDYEDDSELTRLSRTSGSGRTVRVSADLWRVLERAQQVARQTGGAFDVTCGPLVQLWRRARRQRELPESSRLTEAKRAVGHSKLVLDGRSRTARLLAPGMRLDLGAIAKGFAADEALAVLKHRGITRALVAGGGDMAIGESPPDRRGWVIELAPHESPGAPARRFVELSNCGFATSGDVFQHAEIGGTRYSHIVDPRTGIGLTDHSLVIVIARDAMTADSLSTAVSVVGPIEGLKLIGKWPGAEVLVVRNPRGQVESFESRGFSRWSVLPPRA